MTRKDYVHLANAMGTALREQPVQKNLPMWTMVYAIADSLQDHYPNFDWTRFITHVTDVAQRED